MCHITMTRRYDLTKELIVAKPGVYYTAEDLVSYWEKITGTKVALTHVPGVFQAMQKNGLPIHNANKGWCYETEEIRTARLAKEEEIKQARVQAQAERDNVVWAKKRQKVQELETLLQAARQDLKSFEDSRQDSILLVA